MRAQAKYDRFLSGSDARGRERDSCILQVFIAIQEYQDYHRVVLPTLLFATEGFI